MSFASLSTRARSICAVAIILIAATPATVLATHSGNHTDITVTITAPANGATFTRLNTVNFTGTVTHLGCAPTALAWKDNGTTFSTATTAARQFSTLGSKSIQFRADGACGKQSTASVSITIVNVAPTAAISGPTSAPAGTVSFSAAGSADADGTIASYVFTLDGVAQPAQTTSAFQRDFTSVGSHTLKVTVTDNDGASTTSSALAFEIVPAALATITVGGPASLVAGTVGTYTVAGADQYGNAVALAVPDFEFTAPTSVGSASACYTERGVTGCAAVEVVADALASIAVDGPDALVAGTSGTYALAGADQYGNAVALAGSSVVFTAPEAIGAATVSYTESDVTGSKVVSIVSGPLASIEISGPLALVAGTSATYALAGFDQYGNPVTLARSSLEFTAPTTVGTATVEYTESGVPASLEVAVVPDALATIDVSGPATMVAGTSADFAVAGADQYGNAVALGATSLGFTAPTAAGATQACYSEQDVTGCASVNVVADSLASIEVSGPGTMVAGTSATFAIAGFDQHGNAVAVAPSELDFTAPTTAGAAQACTTADGFSDCADVTIVADVLARIAVTGPSSMPAGSTRTFNASGFDQYDNPVALAVAQFAHTAGKAVGTETVSYAESGVTGSRLVQILPVVLALAIDIDARHSAADALTNGISGVVTVRFPGDGVIANADVTVVLLRNVQYVGNVQNETYAGKTRADGTFEFQPSTAFSVPGTYRIIVRASALGHNGLATSQYTVGP